MERGMGMNGNGNGNGNGIERKRKDNEENIHTGEQLDFSQTETQ
jgi:hypothetical protein